MSDDAEQVMGALESLLKDTVLRSLPGASTIAFDLDGDRWCLDPRGVAVHCWCASLRPPR